MRIENHYYLNEVEYHKSELGLYNFITSIATPITDERPDFKFSQICSNVLYYIPADFRKLPLLLGIAKEKDSPQIVLVLEDDIYNLALANNYWGYLDSLAFLVVVDSQNTKLRLERRLKTPVVILVSPISSSSYLEGRSELYDSDNRAAMIDTLAESYVPAGEIEIIHSDRLANLGRPELEEYLVSVFKRYSDLIVFIDIPLDSWVLLAAKYQCRIYTNRADKLAHVVYPHTAQLGISRERVFETYYETIGSLELKDYILTLANCKFVYYNIINTFHRFMSILRAFRVLSGSIPPYLSRDKSVDFNRDIALIHGVKHIEFERKEFGVVCVVKDGSLYVDEWVKHYKSIGAKHIFVVDNDSTDSTVTQLKKYDGVSIFSTSLSFKYYECEIRRFIVETCCPLSWCLTVDIDEFFDFPYSDKLRMDDLLGYLNVCGATAVTANMLDMFSEGLTNDVSFIESDVCFELENVRAAPYISLRGQFYVTNKITDIDMPYFFGGVRSNGNEKIAAQAQFLLLKHPLTFQDGSLIPQVDPHFCDGANVSAVSAVLYHYKLTKKYVNIVLARARGKVFNYFANKEYDSYAKKYTLSNSIFSFNKAEKFPSVSKLKENGFVSAPASLIKASYSAKMK